MHDRVPLLHGTATHAAARTHGRWGCGTREWVAVLLTLAAALGLVVYDARARVSNGKVAMWASGSKDIWLDSAANSEAEKEKKAPPTLITMESSEPDPFVPISAAYKGITNLAELCKVLEKPISFANETDLIQRTFGFNAFAKTCRAEPPLVMGANGIVMGDGPLRLKINGSRLINSQTGEEETLMGFSFTPQRFPGKDEPQEWDRAIKRLLPNTNLARLAMVHWGDDFTTRFGTDCRTANKAANYLDARCVHDVFDVWVNFATNNRMWTILTVRATMASSSDLQTVYNNKIVRAQYLAMLTGLASTYSTHDRIAGYEVLSEPRSADLPSLRQLNLEACAAVKAGDPAALCFIGPPAYDIGLLHHMMLPNTTDNAVYVGQFFHPADYTAGAFMCATTECDATRLAYPGKQPCSGLQWPWEQHQIDIEINIDQYGTDESDIAQPAACQRFVDRDWLEVAVKPFLDMRAGENSDVDRQITGRPVPVMVVQWGVEAHAGPSRAQYARDVMDVFAKHKLHWAMWRWRQDGVEDGESSNFGVIRRVSHVKAKVNGSKVGTPDDDQPDGSYAADQELLMPLRFHLGVQRLSYLNAIAKVDARLGLTFVSSLDWNRESTFDSMDWSGISHESTNEKEWLTPPSIRQDGIIRAANGVPGARFELPAGHVIPGENPTTALLAGRTPAPGVGTGARSGVAVPPAASGVAGQAAA